MKYIYIHKYIHTYVHTYIRTYIHTYNFSSKSKKVTFAHFLMPVMRYNLRKTWWRDFEKSSKKLILCPTMTFFSHYVYNKNFPFKCTTITLNHFPFVGNMYNFRKTSWADLEKKSKIMILDHKMTHFLYFGHSENFT